MPKRATKIISPELRQKLDSQNWKKIIPELTYYAQLKLKNSIISFEKDAASFVSDAIMKIYEGKISWDPEKFPNVYKVLEGNIRSAIGHAFRKKDHKLQLIPDSKEFDELKIDSVYFEVVNIRENSQAKKLHDFLWEYFKNYEKVLEVLICIEDGKGRSEISKELNLPIKEYDNIIKRIKYACKKFKK